MIKFKFLTGDINWQTYGGKFVSNRQSNGEFDYWFVMEVINYRDSGCCDYEHDGDGSTYGVMLTVVAPSQVSEEKRQHALASWGLSDKDWAVILERNGDLAWVEVLSDYGIQALVWQDNGNNLSKLMAEARRQARENEFFFGFAMDKAQNRIGSTGWDFLKGELLAGIGIHD